MKKLWEMFKIWFKSGNHPIVAKEAMVIAAIGLSESIREIKKLDSSLTSAKILEGILDEYNKRCH